MARESCCSGNTSREFVLTYISVHICYVHLIVPFCTNQSVVYKCILTNVATDTFFSSFDANLQNTEPTAAVLLVTPIISRRMGFQVPIGLQVSAFALDLATKMEHARRHSMTTANGQRLCPSSSLTAQKLRSDRLLLPYHLARQSLLPRTNQQSRRSLRLLLHKDPDAAQLTSRTVPQLFRDGAPKASQIVSALVINSGYRMAPSMDARSATNLVLQTMIAAALDFVLMAFAA